MTVKRLLLLSCLVVACGCAPFDGDSVSFNSTSLESLESGGTRFGATIDEVMWNWDVSIDAVKDTPDWEPGTEPPLSLTDAVKIATAEVEKYTGTPRAFRIESVQWLKISHCCNKTHKWIYLVDFERDYESEGQRFDRRATIRIPVLLDGRAIEGKKESPR